MGYRLFHAVKGGLKDIHTINLRGIYDLNGINDLRMSGNLTVEGLSLSWSELFAVIDSIDDQTFQ